ncbi:hypothetical protein [Bradyrhizobium sp. TM102]|uniref:hypothetical protein n=1 Tax=Bradyrhizobium sp. TM102 TaxID=2599819 RepID=UPI0012A136BA|nr:hypothetical protein [Bradyrhizobium sp. TM102]BBO14783.1 hypothetical protein TM102_62530 [Bradyrhizobium sp. TM102]
MRAERKVALRDGTSKYQSAWLEAARKMLAEKSADYDHFEMTRPAERRSAGWLAGM